MLVPVLSADVSVIIRVFFKRHIYIALRYKGMAIQLSPNNAFFQDRNSKDTINSDIIVEAGASFNI